MGWYEICEIQKGYSPLLLGECAWLQAFSHLMHSHSWRNVMWFHDVMTRNEMVVIWCEECSKCLGLKCATIPLCKMSNGTAVIPMGTWLCPLILCHRGQVASCSVNSWRVVSEGSSCISQWVKKWRVTFLTCIIGWDMGMYISFLHPRWFCDR
jgi:hypothetical protein